MNQAVSAAILGGVSFGIGTTVGHYVNIENIVAAWIGVALGIIIVMYLDSWRQ